MEEVIDFSKAELTPEQREEIRLCMPQFSFYTKKGKRADCFCTACQSWYTEESITVKHNELGNCPHCGETVQYKSSGRGMKKYCHHENFALFYNLDGRVIIKCCKAYQTFPNEGKLKYIPDISMYEVFIYVLEPGKAEKVYNSYLYGWIPYKQKIPGEPNLGMSCGCSQEYITISEDCLTSSFLKYSYAALPEIPSAFISYLCRSAIHPNLEYLVKGGFSSLAMSYVRGYSYGVRITWKSNNLLEMLKIDRRELAYLKDKSEQFVGSYMAFRKEFKIKDSAKSVKLHLKYGGTSSVSNAKELMTLAHLSFDEIVRYTEKGKVKSRVDVRTFIHDWLDYIKECAELEYDLNDIMIAMPKDLYAAHERTSSIIRAKQIELNEKKMEAICKRRANMLYTDETRGLITVLPKSVDDIKEEGRIQHHCVCGYAERHLDGVLTIMFLRKINKPDVPYYTMEIDSEYRIVQCRGYANNVERNGGTPKPQEIVEFEKEYSDFLKKALIEEKKRIAKEKAKERKAV